MRCPKCQYISFDTEDRCRNCGYDLTLATAPSEPDLTFARDQPGDVRAPVDLDLMPEAAPSVEPPPPQPEPEETESGEPLDLPLFGEEGVRAPGGLPPSARSPRLPRRSVGVREPVDPLPGRSRQEPRPTLLDAGEEGGTYTETRAATPDLLWAATVERDERDDRDMPASDEPAPLDRRIGAGLVDVFVLVIIDLTVLFLTRRVTGLAWSELGQLPLAPLLGFLFLLDAGYLVTFTAASGQTLGKVLMRLRVVGEESRRVPLGHAIVRAVVSILSVVPFGLGLLPMFFSSDHRAWHDRITGTKVIMA